MKSTYSEQPPSTPYKTPCYQLQRTLGKHLPDVVREQPVVVHKTSSSFPTLRRYSSASETVELVQAINSLRGRRQRRILTTVIRELEYLGSVRP